MSLRGGEILILACLQFLWSWEKNVDPTKIRARAHLQ